MEGFLVSVAPFLILLVVASAETYYITPSSHTPCLEEGVPCFTLSQYATKPSTYFASSTTLILLPGNHILDLELSIGIITFLSVKSSTIFHSDTLITCHRSAKFTFEAINVVGISGLVLLGCMNNEVTRVEQFTLEDCTLQGQGRDGTGLQLNDVSTANITRSSFSFNTGREILFFEDILRLGGAIIIINSTLGVTISDCRCNNNSISGDRGGGGAVFAFLSRITVDNSTLFSNTVIGVGGAGAAVFAASSHITITNSSFYNNTVTGDGGSGGAVYALVSELTVINSRLISNTVTGDVGGYGGAVYADSGPIIVVYSTLNSNTVAGDSGKGGAVYADSIPIAIYIVNTTFKSNTVAGDSGKGGAMYADSSPIKIVNCTLNSNTVTGDSGKGGAAYGFLSNITLENSTLNHNTVTGWFGNGGAVFASSSPIAIDNSMLNSNTVTGLGGAVVASLSSIAIDNSKLNNNTVTGKGAAVLAAVSSPITISNTTFKQSANFGLGGAVFAISSPVTIKNSMLSSNTVSNDGAGALYAYSSPVVIYNTLLNSNTVTGDFGLGGAVYAESSHITINNSIINNNTVADKGGAVYSFSSYINIHNSTINHNIVTGDHGEGGAVYVVASPIIIVDSKLKYNTVTGDHGGGGAVFSWLGPILVGSSTLNSNTVTGNHGGGGAVFALFSGPITIDNSTLNSNAVTGDSGSGGALFAISSSITINNCALNSNTVTEGGGAVYVWSSVIHIPLAKVIKLYNIPIHNYSNTVSREGGKDGIAYSSHITIDNSVFTNNNAVGVGSALYLVSVTLNSSGYLDIQNNMASTSVLYAVESTLYISGNTTVSNNYGSLFVYSCNVTFNGYTNIMNNSYHSNTSQEGGALSAFQSEIVLIGVTNFMYNRAIRGGAIAAVQSKLYTYGNIAVSNNTASVSGGGIYAYQSELNFKENINISKNRAYDRGGGIHAISSTTRLSNGSQTYFAGNDAIQGGGMCLESSAKVYLLKTEMECLESYNFFGTCKVNTSSWITLHLHSNTANYGGAVYVADDTNSATCYVTPFSDKTTVSSECFIQSLALYKIGSIGINLPRPAFIRKNIPTINTYMTNNSATVAGDVLYGGLLDRCKASPFAELFEKYINSTPSFLDARSYIVNITDLEIRDFNSTKIISSDAVRVCFCKDNQPVCSYHPQPKYVRKGETFTMSLVAVDHINNTVANGTIHAFVSQEGKLGEGQSIQQTSGDSGCTDLVYTIVSPHDFEKLHLYAEGPCMSAGISTANVTVNIAPCSIGFIDKDLRCVCDPLLYPEYISSCSIDTETVERKDNVWFSYVNLNSTDHQGYILHKHCPFDYCHPPTVNISVNLSIEDGSNELCAFSRSGKLCGSCEDGLSLSLGSSRCRSCSNSMVALLICFAIAGVVLVAFLLKLNFTVAVGTFNGLIFYANIFIANRAVFFPHDETKILTIFIAWLNLDFGFETCFYDGMDGYVKTWLQLAFPLYVFSLVVAIIVISDYSIKFATLFSGINPIATLATLILLSYTKLLRTIIASLSFTTLQYSDGSHELVWLVDANVPYLRGKHIYLFIAALVIVVVSMMYTFLLFCWQWLVYCPNKGPLRWIIGSTKVIAFMDAYQNPYNKDHRYWIGLLLLVRVLLYLVSALNVLGDPRINLFSIALFVVMLAFFQRAVESKCKIHKERLNEMFESISLLNLAGLTIATFFITEDKGNQNVVAYISTGIAFATFLTILVYHMYQFVFKNLLQKVTTKLHVLLWGTQNNLLFDTAAATPIMTVEEPVSETEFDAIPEPRTDEEQFVTGNETTHVEMESSNLDSHTTPVNSRVHGFIRRLTSSSSLTSRNPPCHMLAICNEKTPVEIELPNREPGYEPAAVDRSQPSVFNIETSPEQDYEAIEEDESTSLLVED